MLRVAREGIEKPPPGPEDDSSNVPDVQGEATESNSNELEATNSDGDQVPMVANGEIRGVKSAERRVRKFQLMVDVKRSRNSRGDGALLAMLPSPALRWFAKLRWTLQKTVSWMIQAVEPGPRDSRMIVYRMITTGEYEEVLHPIADRVIRVLEEDRLIASSVGPIPRRVLFSLEGSNLVVAGGRRFTLSPSFRARRGTIDDRGHLSRGLLPWSFTSREPVPLWVVLLHWHVLSGDWAAPSDDGFH